MIYTMCVGDVRPTGLKMGRVEDFPEGTTIGRYLSLVLPFGKRAMRPDIYYRHETPQRRAFFFMVYFNAGEYRAKHGLGLWTQCRVDWSNYYD